MVVLRLFLEERLKRLGFWGSEGKLAGIVAGSYRSEKECVGQSLAPLFYPRLLLRLDCGVTLAVEFIYKRFSARVRIPCGLLWAAMCYLAIKRFRVIPANCDSTEHRRLNTHDRFPAACSSMSDNIPLMLARFRDSRYSVRYDSFNMFLWMVGNIDAPSCYLIGL